MKKILAEVSKISARTFLYLFAISAIVCIFALRHNNQGMVKLRSAVYTADRDNGDVNTALNNLRRYVYAHMNTNLSSGGNNIKPPIQLKYTYGRLYAARQAALQAANQQTFADAKSYCQSISQAYYGSACVQNYVVNHGVKDANINIPAGLYEFDFISPSWSPDLAGWSLLTSIVLFLAFLVKLLLLKLSALREK